MWYSLTPKVPKRYSGLELGCSMRLRNESFERITQWDPREILAYGPFDFVVQDLMFGAPSFFEVVSDRFRNVVQAAFSDEVWFLECRLQRWDGTGEHKGYHLAQILQKEDCLNTERTPGHWLGEGAGQFFPSGRRFVIKSSFQTDWNIFRPAGQCSALIVSEAFAQVLCKHRLTGCELSPLEVA